MVTPTATAQPKTVTRTGVTDIFKPDKVTVIVNITNIVIMYTMCQNCKSLFVDNCIGDTPSH